jgi:3-hydroxyacyl-CoA dehydrogenase/enoyl-CoA hydratase/3-hydroxybutyryl-CoA epimerase
MPGVLSLSVRPDRVAVLTYDVPGEPVNTLRASFAADFEQALGEVARDAGVFAAILVSGKHDTFIAGADIEMLKAVRTRAEAEALCRAGQAALQRIADAPKPVVAAVHGAALGGGLEVALACHGRVLSDDDSTVLGLPEVQIGLLPALGGLPRLAEKIGLQGALEHGLTGKRMRSPKAKALGVADAVVPLANLRDTSAKLALQLAAKGRPFGARPKKGLLDDGLARLALEGNAVGRRLLFARARKELAGTTGGHYPAPPRIVDVLEAWADRGLDAAKDAEARAFGELVLGPVARRLIEVFLAQAALKKDTGADDPGVLPRPVEKVALIGAGVTLAGIAYVTVSGGIPARLTDTEDTALGVGRVTELLDADVKNHRLTGPERDRRLGLLSATLGDAGMKGADLVIEAAAEDLAAKQKIVREIEADGREGLIFVTTTATIPVAQIALASKRPANVVGMRYAAPAHRAPLLEVVRTKETAPQVVATAVALGKRQGKTVLVVRDAAGFYATRVLAPMLHEAMHLLAEGVAIEAVDEALVAWGWPAGPFARLDEVGIDVAAQAAQGLAAAFGDRMAAPQGLARLAAADRRGRRNKRGFYLYGDAASRKGPGLHVDESVYGALGLPVPGRKGRSVPVEDLQMRCSLALVNEALHALGEGVIRSARDGDVGAIVGLGFPPFRGGPFRWVDVTGAGEVLRRVRAYEQRFGARWTPAPLLVEKAKDGALLHP